MYSLPLVYPAYLCVLPDVATGSIDGHRDPQINLNSFTENIIRFISSADFSILLQKSLIECSDRSRPTLPAPMGEPAAVGRGPGWGSARHASRLSPCDISKFSNFQIFKFSNLQIFYSLLTTSVYLCVIPDRNNGYSITQRSTEKFKSFTENFISFISSR